jgi:hypothetical protein
MACDIGNASETKIILEKYPILFIKKDFMPFVEKRKTFSNRVDSSDNTVRRETNPGG